MYDTINGDQHLLRLPYCNHCLCASCFIQTINMSKADNFRVQVRDEDSDTFDEENDNSFFTCGSFSHRFFKCPFCRMGHLVDRAMFEDIKLHVRNMFLERDNMDKETDKVRYLTVMTDCVELAEQKRALEDEKERLKTDLENGRKEIDRLEAENSELKRKVEKDKEFYRSSLHSLDFYRAFYCEQNIIVTMGKKLIT